MPPKPRINKQMILDASFEIVREQGHEMINARTIAEKLGCSTQPVMYHFKTIGEIREEKAAKIAVTAANTGHLVLTTVHTSRASGVISRMTELGVREDHLYENLLCITNQRLYTNRKNGGKIVLYEIMDTGEIAYYRQNQRNSPDFVSIEKQVRKGIIDGILDQTLL